MRRLIILAVAIVILAATSLVSAAPIKFSVAIQPKQTVFAGDHVFALEDGAISRISLADGSVTKFDFSALKLTAEAMALTAKGVVVVSMPQGIDYDHYRYANQKGFMSVISDDLKTSDTFGIQIDPYAVSVVSGKFAMVTPGSGQWSPSLVIDLTSHTVVDSTVNYPTMSGLYETTWLAANPDSARIYGSNREISPSDLYEIYIDQQTGKFLTIFDSPYHGGINQTNGDNVDAPMGTTVYVDTWLVAMDGGGLYNWDDLNVSADLGVKIDAAAYAADIYTAHSEAGRVTINRFDGMTAKLVASEIFSGEKVLGLSTGGSPVIWIAYTTADGLHLKQLGI